MTEEEVAAEEQIEVNADLPKEVSEAPPSDPLKDPKLRKKLRVTDNEEILMIRKPSFFAFSSVYFTCILVTVFHLMFGWAENIDTEDSNGLVKVLVFLLEIGTVGNVGFVLFMLTYTWLNRLLNTGASGKWVTTYLLIVSLAPLVISLEDIIIDLLTERDEGYIPDFWDYTFFGVMWGVIGCAMTYYFQHSFLYGITTHRVIHTQDFIYERDGHRVLYEDIIAVHRQRSPVGAMFGFATIYCNNGDNSHIQTETVGVAVAAPTESAGGFMGFVKKFFFMLTYQRTTKSERYTPHIALFGIRKWGEAYDLINKLHQENSSSHKSDETVAAIEKLQELVATQSEENSGE